MEEAQRRISLGNESHVDLYEDVLACDGSQFGMLKEFLCNNVARTPNPRRPTTFLKRLQCTFVPPGVSEYKFGQCSQTFRSEVVTWPLLIQEALRLAKQHATIYGVDPDLYNGVHLNLYKDGSVGVQPHADDEASMVEDAPIFSFTLLSNASLPRLFSVYTRNNEKLHDIALPHGSMLVMHGEMQKHFKHGIEASKPPSKYKHLARINLTVRAFRFQN